VAAYEGAVRLLARRDHSTTELSRKLKQKGYERGAIDAALARLAESGTMSDTRFVASFIRQRVARGQGPARIKAELRGQNIDAASIDAALAAAGVDWEAVVLRVYRQKFGGSLGGNGAQSVAERAKRARFLQYRGFDSEQIRAALGSATDDAEDSTFPETW
jgi:regulatory protein